MHVPLTPAIYTQIKMSSFHSSLLYSFVLFPFFRRAKCQACDGVRGAAGEVALRFTVAVPQAGVGLGIALLRELGKIKFAIFFLIGKRVGFSSCRHDKYSRWNFMCKLQNSSANNSEQ